MQEIIKPFLLFSVITAFWASTAQAAIDISFKNPERYTDAGRYLGDRVSEQVIQELKEYPESLGERYLKPNQSLKIEILDIDLAGCYEPFHQGGFSDVRILREVTWPRIKVRYALEENGEVTLQKNVTEISKTKVLRSSTKASHHLILAIQRSNSTL
ncbi:DUF3016 domain-containing protein [Candidatus Manganitrophus noduliformans]|uniref:DUF3016 domain-containing protein n=1 Tax=Candidatus Manganitrophus noduliformans TaxID=2606439 RepID=A0A7X6DPT1_9BACT|nr:DUF3016 domain-containing protein [Candidatus Manganitrophus noduliformans]NKE70848.1 DUF3016 domain-containing protein [Candidatus Manganitrophus noduliformans]